MTVLSPSLYPVLADDAIMDAYLCAPVGEGMSRVLVVDDEPGIVRFVSRALAAEGLSVDAVGDGVRALEIAAAGLHQLVILDLMLPSLDGVSVLRGILDRRPDQKIIVLSAIGEVESKVRCLDYGAVDYLAKPFAIAELIARVRARLRESGSPANDRWLQAAGLRLDLRRRTLHREDRKLPLSQREFLLLQHLMTRADEVCTREELLADVWGYAFDPGSNVVDVYVRRLRGKLDEGRIETVRNVGYVFQTA